MTFYAWIFLLIRAKKVGWKWCGDSGVFQCVRSACNILFRIGWGLPAIGYSCTLYASLPQTVIPAKAGILRNMLRGINSICTARSLLTPASVRECRLPLCIRAGGQGWREGRIAILASILLSRFIINHISFINPAKAWIFSVPAESPALLYFKYLSTILRG